MDLLISIVTWNTREVVKSCLHSLRKHTRPEQTRVIIIDNASSDGTPEMITSEFPDVTLVKSGGNLGFGKGHNLVAHHSTEPYILFLNPDAELIESSPERMLEVMKKDPRIGAVGCRMIDSDGSVQPLGYQLYPSPWTELLHNVLSFGLGRWFVNLFLPRHDPLKDGFVRKLYGGCLMVRRDILDDVGWFDERFFMYGEDVDLSRRIAEAGFQLYYLSSTRVIHHGAAASSKAPGRFATLMQCESIAKLMQKYYGRSGRVIYVASILIRAISRLAMIGVMKIIALFAPGARRAGLEKSRQKHLAMLRWSLGRAHPTIPQ